MQPSQTPVVNVPIIKKHAETVRLDSVSPKRVEWLQPGRIALGKLSLISGDPGLGKSLVTLDMAARVSQGRNWQDGSCCPTGEVLMLSAEDSVDDTIRPRLDACGGDPAKVHVMTLVSDVGHDGQVKRRGFSIEADMDEMERHLEGHPSVRLVVIDPISAYLGRVDSHNNAEVRAILTPLAELAERRRIAVVAVTHLNKGNGKAIYRQAGSIAFTAAARASYVVCKDPDDPQRRLFIPVKNNLGDDRTGFAYRVEETSSGAPRVRWEPEPIPIDDIDEAVGSQPMERGTALREAEDFLGDLLVTQPLAAKDVLAKARAAGHSDSTVRRAKENLRVRSVKQAVSGTWVWKLPEQDAQPPLPTNLGHLEHVEHLDQEEGEII